MNARLWAIAAILFAASDTSARGADYHLPFAGRWFVLSGGDTINVNHHMIEKSQWYAVDFMKTGGPGGRAVTKNEGKSVEDYYSWGQDVLSPVTGTVGVVHDGDPDNPIGTTDKKNAYGNYVVIEISPTEFVYLAHFQKASIRVKPGQRVKPGDILGKCGNSGNTSGPHIHMHVQDRLTPYTGTGQNITFQQITVLLAGKQFDNVDWPLIKGLFVWQGEDR